MSDNTFDSVEVDAEVAALLTVQQHKIANAYTERNALVAALSRMYPSHLMKHGDDPQWDPEWLWIVCIDSPAGQLSWHLHDAHLPMFSHLVEQPNDWDGHTTEEKYARVAKLGVEAPLFLAMDADFRKLAPKFPDGEFALVPRAEVEALAARHKRDPNVAFTRYAPWMDTR